MLLFDLQDHHIVCGDTTLRRLIPNYHRYLDKFGVRDWSNQGRHYQLMNPNMLMSFAGERHKKRGYLQHISLEQSIGQNQ
jgi:hypothetical protein